MANSDFVSLETRRHLQTKCVLAIDSGIVTGDALVSYWPIFSLSLVTVPEVFAKVNSSQFSSRILRGGSRGRL